jgi:hypothetical protein
MDSFKQFFEAKKFDVIHFFDVDETLFNTFAMIIVRDSETGKEIKQLTNVEFNSYKPKDGEEFDFSQFRDGELFKSTSRVIDSTLKEIKKAYNNPNTLIVFLTARSDFDDNKSFKDAFRNVGIKTNDNRVRFELSGNLKRGTVESKKEFIIKKYLNRLSPNVVTIWDDHVGNLEIADKLAPMFPDIVFHKIHIKDGRTGKTKMLNV